MQIKITRYKFLMILSVFLSMAIFIPALALAQVTVTTPTNDSTVGMSFTLQASSTSCSGQSTVSMGYSFDNSSSTTIFNPAQSIDTTADAPSTGAHVLHVKAWGSQGSACSTDVDITVQDGVVVTTPANNSSVSTTFPLEATSATCQGQTTVSMGYSFDNSSNTTIFDAQSIDTNATTTVGAHVLHVKSWGNSGSACSTAVNITVTANDGVTVTQPTANENVNSPFSIVASATTCQGQTVVSMGYSFDNSSNTTIFDAQSINVNSATTTAGAHVLHVKAWGNSGSSCSTPVNIVVGASGPSIPTGATTWANIDLNSNWGWRHDPDSGTSSSGNSALVSTPINNVSQSRSYTTSFTGGGGELFYDTFTGSGGDTTDTNFVYDNWVYIQAGSNIGNLEMDLNQTLPISGSSNTNLIIMGFQCAKEASGGPAWQYTYIASGSTHWRSSSWSCDPSTWSTNTWHHVQIAMSHDGSGNVTYQAVWLDGVEMDINATVASIEVNNWALVLLSNFQIDGYGSTGSTQLYTNGMTYYSWH